MEWIYLSRVVHFEIPADNPERAVKFYENVFKWKIDKWDQFEYWLVTTGDDDEPGINGAILPNDFSSNVRDTINVDSYDEFAEKIENAGGKMLSEKMNVPELGVTGMFQDTEGNIFGIIEYNKD
jgi:uncharacterized protein